MAKKKQSQRIKIIDTTSAATYHTVRIAQRLTLLAAAGLALWYFVTLVSVSSSLIIAGAQENIRFNNPELVNATITMMIEKLRGWSVSMSVVSLLITGLLVLFPRVRRFDKKTVIDGVIIAVFLLAFTQIAQGLITYLISQI